MLGDSHKIPMIPGAGGSSFLDAPSDGNTYGRKNGAWAIASASPAGSNTQVQYNNNGVFGASANLTFIPTGISLYNRLNLNAMIHFNQSDIDIDPVLHSINLNNGYTNIGLNTSDGGPDYLETVNGVNEGDMIFLSQGSFASTVTLKNSTSLILHNGIDYDLVDQDHILMFMVNSNGYLVEVGRPLPQDLRTSASPTFANIYVPTVYGGTSSGGNLALKSTSNSTKGKILFGTSAYDEVNNRLGIGLTSPTASLSIQDSLAAAADNSKGLLLINPTAATTGNQKWSPAIRWQGNGWSTNLSQSTEVDFRMYVKPVQDTITTGELTIDVQKNNTGYNPNGQTFKYDSTGLLTVSSLSVINNFTVNTLTISGINDSYVTYGNSDFITGFSDSGGAYPNTAFLITNGYPIDFYFDGGSSALMRIGTGGKFDQYAGVTTAGYGVPAIYGSNRATGQTGAVTSVAAYTVGSSDGSFIVSGNINVTAFTAGTITLQVTYTDETNTARTLTMNTSNVSGTIGITVGAAGAFEGVPLHIRCKASTSITIKTTVSVFTGTYNVEGNIMQIA